jgi:hypothetical protein
MGIATQMLIAEKYGLLLGIEELAALLGYEPRYVQNLIYSGKLPIPTSKVGARTVAHYADVAAYVDSLRAAREAARDAA